MKCMIFILIVNRERARVREREIERREREWNRIYLIKKYLDLELE